MHPVKFPRFFCRMGIKNIARNRFLYKKEKQHKKAAKRGVKKGFAAGLFFFVFGLSAFVFQSAAVAAIRCKSPPFVPHGCGLSAAIRHPLGSKSFLNIYYGADEKFPGLFLLFQINDDLSIFLFSRRNKNFFSKTLCSYNH